MARKSRKAKSVPVRAGKAAKSLGLKAKRYNDRLKVLRQLTSRFDARHFENAFERRVGKTRSADLRKVSATWRRLSPYLQRNQKIIVPKRSKSTARNLEELRKYVGFPKLPGLRGVPVETARPDKTTVSFDRKGRPTIKSYGTKWKIFRFSRMPRDGYHIENGVRVFRTAADDAIHLMQELVNSRLPAGGYVFMTRHHFLLKRTVDRGQIMSSLRQYVHEYGDASGGFAKLLFGLKWLGRSPEAADNRRRKELSEREWRNQEKRRRKSEKAAREIARMHKIFTGQTRDAELLKLHRARNAKISRRARITGRR